MENPGTDKVRNLLSKVDDGAFVIPYFQRGFEWKPRMVSELFESILQDYFAGLLLLWELDPENARNEEWDSVWGVEKRNPTPEIAILDGQQRLASLYYAIYNPKKNFPNRQSYYTFFVDLTKVLNEEYEGSVSYQFFFSNYQSWHHLKQNQEEWTITGRVPLSILSAKDPDDNKKDYIISGEFNEWINRYLEVNKNRLPSGTTVFTVYKVFNGILDYSFLFYPLSSERDLHDICNIFANVNSKGMKLSTFDLMNAFLYPKGILLRKNLWENLVNEQLKQLDSSMDEYLLKSISLIKQNYCSAKYLYNLIPGELTTRKDEQEQKYEEILVENSSEFKQLWIESCKYSENARKRIMNTGPGDFGAIKKDFIPNTTIVPVMAAILWEYNGDPDDQTFITQMQKWYWSAVFSEDYSGSSDSVMAKDFRDWKEMLKSGKAIERINRMTPDFIQELDIKNINKGSARYSAIISMLALNNAQDFYKGRIVGTVDYSKESINDHHIFPSKISELNPIKSSQFINNKDSIVNRTLLLDETNQIISNKKPSEYVGDMIRKHGSEEAVQSLLAAHFINESALIFMLDDDFDNFILEREKEIKLFLISKLGL